MKRNLYNLKLRGTGGEEDGGIGIGIGGIGIANPDGEGIGISTPGAGSSESITPYGYQFYNVQLDRVWYFLKCAGGDNLTGQDYTAGDGYYLRAQNIE